MAGAEAAARVDADPPLLKLLKALEEGSPKEIYQGNSVIYWI